MLKIGRYGIALGPVLWLQTKVPTKVWHFLCFWFIKEARPNDVDKEARPNDVDKEARPNDVDRKQQEQEGRQYRYWKASEERR